MINEEVIAKKITPKNDIIFKKIFGSKGNEGILKDFLEGILETQIESVKLGLETELLLEFYLRQKFKIRCKNRTCRWYICECRNSNKYRKLQ